MSLTGGPAQKPGLWHWLLRKELFFLRGWLARREESVSLSVVLTLRDPIHCSPPGFSVHRILQARIRGWVAMPFSRASTRPRDPSQVSCLQGDSLPSEQPGKSPSMVSRGKRASAPDLPGQWTLALRRSSGVQILVTFRSPSSLLVPWQGRNFGSGY